MSQLWQTIRDRCDHNVKIYVAVTTTAVGLVYVARSWLTRRELLGRADRKKKQCQQALRQLQSKLQESELDERTDSWILEMSITDLQRALYDGTVTATAVLRAYQREALYVNERLNCITEPVIEAEDCARRLDLLTEEKGLLHGVPISLKESYNLTGYDTTAGLCQLIGKPANEDAVLVQVLKEQGAVPFVKTNIPQVMMTYECSNPIFGQTNNPYDRSRGPGGSTGGEGALIGARASILGFGSDIGGSIRFPSHVCGCYGLKTTKERLSGKGHMSLSSGQTLVSGTVGPMSRDLDGLVLAMKALLCDHLFKLDPKVPPIPFRSEIYESTRPLRVGFYVNDGYVPSAPACQRAVLMAKSALERQGHTVIEFTPPRVKDVFADLYMKSVLGDAGQNFDKWLKRDIIDPIVLMQAPYVPNWVLYLMTYVAQFLARAIVVFILVSSASNFKEEEKKKEVDASLKRVMRMNAPEWYLIMFGCFASLLNGGVMPAFAIIFSEIIGVFSLPDLEEQKRKVAMYAGIFVGIGALSFFTYLTQGYMFGRSGEYLTLRLRHLSFKAMLRQEISWYDDHENNTGALTTRLATDASQVQGAAGIRLGTTIMSLCSLLTGIIIAFVYGWKLSLVILGFVPFLMIGGYFQMKMLVGAAGKNKEALEAAGKVAVESIENIRTVVSMTKEEMFFKNYMQELEVPYRAALKNAYVVGVSFSFSQAIIFFCYAASFWFGAYLITENEMVYVDVFKVFSSIVFDALAIGQASSFAPDASKAQASAVQIFTLLDQEPSIDSESPDGEKPKEGEFSSTVSFHDVKFCYPTRPDVQVLNGLNISVTPGQTLALVGSSGCGKSTTVQLIERFYDAQSGDVTLDRYKLQDLNLQWLRSQVGIVSQEPVLFDRSIAENIAYGDNSRAVPMAEVIQAARKSNIHDFISSLPDGYDTNVGEKGAQLSGGQKQRVAIARALVRNPKILLLDEATSALDTESEKVVQEALDKAREGRTSIVIAHRLSTIQNAHKICVIRHGVVTEEGTHNDLMKSQGFYYKLNMAQARKK